MTERPLSPPPSMPASSPGMGGLGLGADEEE
jgi:hypothetical protein